MGWSRGQGRGPCPRPIGPQPLAQGHSAGHGRAETRTWLSRPLSGLSSWPSGVAEAGRGETFLLREGPSVEPALLGREMPCFLHKQPGPAGAILFLFPIFTSPLALFSNSGLDRPPPSSLHPASWRSPGAVGKPSVCARDPGSAARLAHAWWRGARFSPGCEVASSPPRRPVVGSGRWPWVCPPAHGPVP